MEISDISSLNKLSSVLLSLGVMPKKIVIGEQKTHDINDGITGRIVDIHCDLRGLKPEQIINLQSELKKNTLMLIPERIWNGQNYENVFTEYSENTAISVII